LPLENRQASCKRLSTVDACLLEHHELLENRELMEVSKMNKKEILKYMTRGLEYAYDCKDKDAMRTLLEELNYWCVENRLIAE